MSHNHEHAVPYHGNLKDYLTGFVLSLILTVIPFGLVMAGKMSETAIMVGIFLAALVQVVVHLRYFLHLDTSPEQRWNLMVFLFMVISIVILVVGSVWIMYNMRIRMTDYTPSTNMNMSAVDMPPPVVPAQAAPMAMPMPEKGQP